MFPPVATMLLGEMMKLRNDVTFFLPSTFHILNVYFRMGSPFRDAFLSPVGVEGMWLLSSDVKIFV